MCYKTHKLYKPSSLTKEQREILEKQEKREMLIALVMILLGAIIVTIIFKLMAGAIDAV